INRAAFANPPVDASGAPTRQGTLGRGVIRGLGFWQVDFALRREFKLTERVKAQFRAEFFNVLNHPNFGPPVTSLSPNVAPAQFGVPNSTLANVLGGAAGLGGGFNPQYQSGGARSTQFALRLSF
ncbi:MAG: TonB-dependent receptor, partial [Blastocatellia bacterium]